MGGQDAFPAEHVRRRVAKALKTQVSSSGSMTTGAAQSSHARLFELLVDERFERGAGRGRHPLPGMVEDDQGVLGGLPVAAQRGPRDGVAAGVVIRMHEDLGLHRSDAERPASKQQFLERRRDLSVGDDADEVLHPRTPLPSSRPRSTAPGQSRRRGWAEPTTTSVPFLSSRAKHNNWSVLTWRTTAGEWVATRIWAP